MRVLACLVILTLCVAAGHASATANPPPVATLDLTKVLQPGHGEFDWTTIAFVSENTIAVGLCSDAKAGKCSLSLVHWQDGVLQPFPQTQALDARSRIHPLSEGRVLTTCISFCKPVLFSADLSTSLRLPLLIDPPSSALAVSPSGSTIATKSKDSWTIYRLSDGLELARQGGGSLRAISDEVVVFQDGRKMRTETLDGKALGSFPVKREDLCWIDARILGHDRLYLDRGYPVVTDFEGRELLRLHRLQRCSGYQATASADGKRLLFDQKSREVSQLRIFGESALEIALLGNADLDPEDNREEVRVADTVPGATCFEWRRSFPMGAGLHFVDVASLSPSGAFVAIAAGKTLSIYRLPAVCEARE
jgi:hypothetical protein